MNLRKLPKSFDINGTECKINSDFRDILDLFEIMNNPDLLEAEKLALSLEYFYVDSKYVTDIETAVKYMMEFISMTDYDNKPAANRNANDKPLYDWEQDFNIIIAPVNRILGYDVREKDYVHWWTFLSAFMEIGECTFNTYVGIRDKINKGKKLEKWEEQILRDNRDAIILKRKVDSTTQSLMDEIMGV